MTGNRRDAFAARAHLTTRRIRQTGLQSLTPLLTLGTNALTSNTIMVSRTVSGNVVTAVGRIAPTSVGLECQTDSTLLTVCTTARDLDALLFVGAVNEANIAEATAGLTVMMQWTIGRNVIALICQ